MPFEAQLREKLFNRDLSVKHFDLRAVVFEVPQFHANEPIGTARPNRSEHTGSSQIGLLWFPETGLDQSTDVVHGPFRVLAPGLHT